jgi:Flp pilus assembly pilin Flp
MSIVRLARPVLRRIGECLRGWSERGATSVEYAIIAAAVAATVILGVVFLGQQTQGNFDCTKESVKVQADQCVPGP